MNATDRWSDGRARVLITGGSGFLGTNAVDAFLGDGRTVRSFDITVPANAAHRSVWERVDLLDRDSLRRRVERFEPTHVLHLGARTDLEGSSGAEYRANTVGLANLLEALSQVPSVERAVFASSRLVCKIGYQPTSDTDYCPTTAYGASKVEGEQLLREASELDFEWTIVRPTSIWGPWFGVPYRDFFEAVLNGRYVHPAGRRVNKSFGFVGNTVYQLECLLAAEAETVDRRLFYLGDYPPIELLDWAQRIRAHASRRPVRQAPSPVLRAGARGGDLLALAGWKSVPLTSFRLDNLVTEMVFDLKPLESVVGDLPFSLDEGIAATIDWLTERGA